MIYDATVEVCCDMCRDAIDVEPAYVFNNYSGNSGHYDTRESAIEDILVEQHEWIVTDGQHYCCQECADNHRI